MLGLNSQPVDYAGSVVLDWTSESAKCEVQSVKTFVDGDTTHFYVPTSVNSAGFVKARYLGIDTPESTGKIEKWGKAASKFTRSKLENATSIVIESDDANWNVDSTGDRFLLWIWYQPSEGAEYRNLNIELLQEGLAIANKSASNRYGETCMAAIAQAKELALKINSTEADPDFFSGDAIPVTLKELRTNIKAYEGANVAVEGVITKIYNNGAFIESYDDETGMYHGFYMYFGFNLGGAALEMLSMGNEVRVVGSVQYYEAGNSYQISGILYNHRKPDDPNNSKLISEGNTPSYVETDANTFVNGTVSVIVNEDGEEVMKEFKYAELALGTTVSMNNLYVKKVYTTTNEDSSQHGALTLTCEVNGVTVSIRTSVLKDAEGNLITAEYFNGKTIDIRGVVDSYGSEYQIRVTTLGDIVVH
jgi:micrococcal nuclease